MGSYTIWYVILQGLLVDVGLGRRKVEDIKGYLAAKDRRVIGKTAPAQGFMFRRNLSLLRNDNKRYYGINILYNLRINILYNFI